MAKSTAEKLQIKRGSTVWASDRARLSLLGALPADVRITGALADASTGVVFADDEASLRRVLAASADAVRRAESLWVAYPKGNRADINRDSLWPVLGEYGLRPIGQVAIDEVWSALRFRPLRPGEPQFRGA
jgi:hypothetical protein